MNHPEFSNQAEGKVAKYAELKSRGDAEGPWARKCGAGKKGKGKEGPGGREEVRSNTKANLYWDI